jgi:DNA-binding SARP family transcriptional activator
MSTEFLLLGTVAARADGTPVRIPAAKHRTVLAALLLRANQVVPVEELAEVLWGESLPSAARTGVQNYVMLLRRALGDAGSRISTQPRGYLIRVEAGELDLDRFDELLRQARTAARDGKWPDAADRAAAALELWRGEPLADVSSDLLTAREGPRLAELRLQALETRIEAELRLGRHGEVIGELRQLAAEHPLRERLHALLMLALYQDGRQAEALAAYQRARDVLIEELGAEPGPDLQQLHQQILTADSALVLTSSSPTALALASPLPRELPGDVSAFTGRATELAELDQILLSQGDGDEEKKPTAAVISAVSGTAGVGKTALAVRWAHHAAKKFPDGQLHVNLRGYDPALPVTAADALAAFLGSLGVPGHDIPLAESERAARYRSLLAGRQMLVVLDNASSVEQVRPLLPGHPACAVVVTSRDSLAGLVARDGAHRIDLDLLPLTDAVALLRQLIGTRVDAEADAAVTLAEQCARLPLALRVAAELAAARPHAPLASLVTELSGERQRLDMLQAGGDPATSVRAVFSWSYKQLTIEAARLFRLLGLHPGPDISVAAAASLAAVQEPAAPGLLGELARAHLLAEPIPGRYAFHDLLRAYAAERAHAHDSQDDRDAAIGRVLDHYLHTAARAAILLNPAREPDVLAAPKPGAAPEQLADSREALAWLEAELPVLVAAVTFAAESEFDSHTSPLANVIVPFLARQGHYQEFAATQRTALAAAARLGDARGQAESSLFLGSLYTKLGAEDQALALLADSLELFRQLGDSGGEAAVHNTLVGVADRQGRYADALGHAEEALRLKQAIGNEEKAANDFNTVGWFHALLGHYEEARAFCGRSLSLVAELRDPYVEASTRDSLGYIEHQLGNFGEAEAHYERALTVLGEFANRDLEATVLTHLGDTRQAAGQLAQAQETWQHALAILQDLHHPDADQVRAKLVSVNDHAS